MNRKQMLFIFAIVLLVCTTHGISVGGNVDANGDGVVNTKDLEFVDAHLGRIGTHPADVNDDNVVNIVDLMLVKNAIGTRTTPPPSGDVGWHGANPRRHIPDGKREQVGVLKARCIPSTLMRSIWTHTR